MEENTHGNASSDDAMPKVQGSHASDNGTNESSHDVVQGEAQSDSDAKKVELYSTESCHFCHLAKDFFEENNIEFTTYDVGADTAKRSEMIDMTGQMGVPVIKIGDDAIVGFNEEKVRELLGMEA